MSVIGYGFYLDDDFDENDTELKNAFIGKLNNKKELAKKIDEIETL